MADQNATGNPAAYIPFAGVTVDKFVDNAVKNNTTLVAGAKVGVTRDIVSETSKISGFERDFMSGLIPMKIGATYITAALPKIKIADQKSVSEANVMRTPMASKFRTGGSQSVCTIQLVYSTGHLARQTNGMRDPRGQYALVDGIKTELMHLLAQLAVTKYVPIRSEILSRTLMPYALYKKVYDSILVNNTHGTIEFMNALIRDMTQPDVEVFLQQLGEKSKERRIDMDDFNSVQELIAAFGVTDGNVAAALQSSMYRYIAPMYSISDMDIATIPDAEFGFNVTLYARMLDTGLLMSRTTSATGFLLDDRDVIEQLSREKRSAMGLINFNQTAAPTKTNNEMGNIVDTLLEKGWLGGLSKQRYVSAFPNTIPGQQYIHTKLINEDNQPLDGGLGLAWQESSPKLDGDTSQANTGLHKGCFGLLLRAIRQGQILNDLKVKGTPSKTDLYLFFRTNVTAFINKFLDKDMPPPMRLINAGLLTRKGGTKSVANMVLNVMILEQAEAGRIGSNLDSQFFVNRFLIGKGLSDGVHFSDREKFIVGASGQPSATVLRTVETDAAPPAGANEFLVQLLQGSDYTDEKPVFKLMYFTERGGKAYDLCGNHIFSKPSNPASIIGIPDPKCVNYLGRVTIDTNTDPKTKGITKVPFAFAESELKCKIVSSGSVPDMNKLSFIYMTFRRELSNAERWLDIGQRRAFDVLEGSELTRLTLTESDTQATPMYLPMATSRAKTRLKRLYHGGQIIVTGIPIVRKVSSTTYVDAFDVLVGMAEDTDSPNIHDVYILDYGADIVRARHQDNIKVLDNTPEVQNKAAPEVKSSYYDTFADVDYTKPPEAQELKISTKLREYFRKVKIPGDQPVVTSAAPLSRSDRP